MNRNYAIVALALVMLSSVVFVTVDDATDVSAEGGSITDGRHYYFYGDHPTFRYEFTPVAGAEIEWRVLGTDGTLLREVPRGTVWSIDVDLSTQGPGPVTVVQEVFLNGESKGTATLYAHPLHIGDGVYTVTFMDGASVYGTQYIDHTTMVEVGKEHVIMPSAPEKNGYTFDGWYTDQSYVTEFDPKEPISKDTTVYAKWVGSGAPSGGTVVVNNTHVVTFDTVTGLEYDVASVTSTRVTFTVSVVGGYQLQDGTLSVTSDRGNLRLSNGVYTLTVDSNTVVKIDGVVVLMPVDEGDDDGGNGGCCDFPWWIILLVILIAVVVIILIWWKYRKNDEDELADAVEGSAASGVVFETRQSGIREADDPKDSTTEDSSERKD